MPSRPSLIELLARPKSVKAVLCPRHLAGRSFHGWVVMDQDTEWGCYEHPPDLTLVARDIAGLGYRFLLWQQLLSSGELVECEPWTPRLPVPPQTWRCHQCSAPGEGDNGLRVYLNYQFMLGAGTSRSAPWRFCSEACRAACDAALDAADKELWPERASD